ncbi:TPM_phosphatase domain-containing protein [Psidium guajava]|nr:TPM_phosphatase domain-containing protein [Psidium guajava]
MPSMVVENIALPVLALLRPESSHGSPSSLPAFHSCSFTPLSLVGDLSSRSHYLRRLHKNPIRVEICATRQAREDAISVFQNRLSGTPEDCKDEVAQGESKHNTSSNQVSSKFFRDTGVLLDR